MTKYNAAIIAVSVILVTGQTVGAQNVGVLAAINQNVIGERPQEQPRTLFLNENLILNERVLTTTIGGGQVMFLDQTTLTLSPNSNILLDRYVYDPTTRTGEIGMTMLVGAMRFVGGRITKTSEATIRTPTATIGIRGGIGHITVGADGSTQYIHVAGSSSTVANDKGSATVTRPGAAVFVPAVVPLDGSISAAQSASGDASSTDQTPAVQAANQSDEAQRQRLARPDVPLDQALNADQSTAQRNAAAQDQSFGRRGGAPQFTGIATPEAVEIAINGEGGSGPEDSQGGSRRAVTLETTRAGIDQIETRISLADNALQQPPISTFGEKEEETLDSPPLDLGSLPLDILADSTIAQAIVDELDMIQDGLTIRSDWTALAGLADGTFIRSAPGLAFELRYSLTAGEGLVSVELPDTGDISAANLTLLDGTAISGDQFLVIGDESLNLVGDGGQATLLQGDAGNTEIQISPGNRGSGFITIDYAGSNLQNLTFVDGPITPATGQRGVDSTIKIDVRIFETGQ